MIRDDSRAHLAPVSLAPTTELADERQGIARTQRDAGPRHLPRIVAGAAMASALSHLALAAHPQDQTLLARAVLVGMAVACVGCVRGLLRAPSARTWVVVSAMYSAMLVVHLMLLHPMLENAGSGSATSASSSDLGYVVLMQATHALPIVVHVLAVGGLVLVVRGSGRRR